MFGLDFLSTACILSTIALYSTGIPQCLQMIKQKRTSDVPFLPFIMTCFNNLSWILYSTLTNDGTILVVNMIGVVLQIIYIVVYFICGKSKFREIQLIGIAGLCISLCWAYLHLQHNKAIATNVMGMVCVIVTVLMFFAPLAQMKTVVEKRSTESLSFPLTVATLGCTIPWTMYGILVEDYFIIIPNFIGLLTSLPRFYLFAKYGRKLPGQPEIYSA